MRCLKVPYSTVLNPAYHIHQLGMILAKHQFASESEMGRKLCKVDSIAFLDQQSYEDFPLRLRFLATSSTAIKGFLSSSKSLLMPSLLILIGVKDSLFT